MNLRIGQFSLFLHLRLKPDYISALFVKPGLEAADDSSNNYFFCTDFIGKAKINNRVLIIIIQNFSAFSTRDTNFPKRLNCFFFFVIFCRSQFPVRRRVTRKRLLSVTFRSISRCSGPSDHSVSGQLLNDKRKKRNDDKSVFSTVIILEKKKKKKSCRCSGI